MPRIVYCTGLTGFIGRNLLPHLLQRYDQVINFQRNQQYQLIDKNGTDFHPIDDLKSNNLSSNILINLATLYNPNPKSADELADLINSNVTFQSQLIERLKNLNNLFVISTQSYMQLLPMASQNQYSLTKEILKKNFEQNEFHQSNLYLFDTFGEGDTRNKVVDVFINNILRGQPITIPSHDVEINLSYVQDVCTSIINSIDMDPGEYSIFSPNTILLEDLAKLIMNIMKKNVEILKEGDGQNFISQIKELPLNIFPAVHSDFQKSILSKIKNI